MKLYSILRAVAPAVLGLFFRPRVVMGKEHLDQDQPVIYCANHRHLYDPFLLAVFVKKDIHFMAKKELFSNRFLAWALNNLGAFPVDRQKADVASIKRAVAALDAGEPIGIFPEGTRGDGDEMGQIHAGAVWIALKGGVSIVPAYIDCKGFFRKTRIFVGEKIDFSLAEGERINAAKRDEGAQKLSAALLQLEEIAKNWSEN